MTNKGRVIINMEHMKPDEIVELFKKKLKKSAIIDSKIKTKTAGIKRNSYNIIWLQVKPENLKDAVKLLSTLHFPHLAIISGNDMGEEIELIYHFSIYYGERFKEISIDLSIHLSKKDLRIPTITDLIPGAQVTEREMKEMMGIIFEGLPDLPNLFLPQDFSKDIYPFRRDEKGIYPLSKNGNYVGNNIVKKEEVKKVE
jgi:membrane-bound hydrogenase subunit beta